MPTQENEEKDKRTWEGDKFQRKSEAEFLTLYLTQKFEHANQFQGQSFVLNLNAEWGFGKTYFLSKWEEHLKNSGYAVAHFDAWKNDFSDSPLLCFISEVRSTLKDLVKSSKSAKPITKTKQQVISKALSKINEFAKTAAPIIATAVVKKTVGHTFEELQDAFSDDGENEELQGIASDIAEKLVEQALSNHKTSLDAIDSFIKETGKIIEFLSRNNFMKLPLFIFVDELDRCRPSFSIELLETIKHLFQIDGVYFVVATASEQLTHSINAIYGERFDSKQYLNRFFDQEYTLLEPRFFDFIESIWTQLIPTDNCFKPALPELYYKGKYKTIDSPDLLNIVVLDLVARYYKASLRDVEQAVKLLQAINLTNKHRLYSPLLFTLIICKIRHHDLYKYYSLNWPDNIDGEQRAKYIDKINKSVQFFFSENAYSVKNSIKQNFSVETLSSSFFGLMKQSAKKLASIRNSPNPSVINNTIIDEFGIATEAVGSKSFKEIECVNYIEIINQVGRLQ